MIVASCYGRLSRDPDLRTTKSGKPMVIGNLAVDCGKPDAEQTMWLSVLCFGDQAEAMAKLGKGDWISVVGKLSKSVYQAQGSDRESWSLIADGIVSARTSRPGGRPKAPSDPAMQAPDRMRPDRRDGDDGLPFGGG